jgi:KDO2-lipid IV(A) lauroyltransferase
VIPFVPRRRADGTGYELIILEDISASLQGADKETVATQMNRAIERAVLMAPEQYMWLHRRFKTRPEGQPDRYARRKSVASRRIFSPPTSLLTARASSAKIAP